MEEAQNNNFSWSLLVLFTWYLTNVIIPMISFQNDPENDISLKQSLTPRAPAETTESKW